jgi:hypothetical protein
MRRRRVREKQPPEVLCIEKPNFLLDIVACAGMLRLIAEFACSTLEEWGVILTVSKVCKEEFLKIEESLFTMGALFLYPLSFKIIHVIWLGGGRVQETEHALHFDGAINIKDRSLWETNMSGIKSLRSCYNGRFGKFAFPGRYPIGMTHDGVARLDSFERREGYYVAYDKDESFAICLYGKDHQNKVELPHEEVYDLALEDGSEMMLETFEVPDMEIYNEFVASSPDRCLYAFHLRTQYSENLDIYVTGKYISYLNRWKPELWPVHGSMRHTQWWETRAGGRLLQISCNVVGPQAMQ